MSTAAQKKKSTPEAVQDRRKQILRAAIEVFAERGFHRTRVSDIAHRAGVAYGLIYHYFDSKDDVLNSVFEENWAVFLKVLEELHGDPEMSAKDKLSAIAHLLISALRAAPKLIEVIIQEVSRSDRFVHPKKVEAFEKAFTIVREIIEEGQKNSEVRAELNPQVTAYMFFGALETVCTGFLLKTIPCGTDEEANALKSSITQGLLHGILVPAWGA